MEEPIKAERKNQEGGNAMNGYGYDGEPAKRWYDWLFIMTVSAFAAAMAFVVADSMLSVRLWRVIASLLVAGTAGVVALSVMEDVDMAWRFDRKAEDGKGEKKERS